MKKTIFTAASPNTQFDDVLVALRTFYSPWTWNSKSTLNKFATVLKSYLNIKNIEFVDSGRAALYVILQSIGINEGDEVILPSYTCVVVANSVVWSGARPIYLDSNQQDFNADYNLIRTTITPKTKALLVQHTFGKRVDVDSIRNILKNLNREDIIIIEDFAHIIQREINLKGDIGFLTFGIEKVISTVRGGAIISNEDKIISKASEIIQTLAKMSTLTIIQALFNVKFWYFVIPLHSISLGRFSLGSLLRRIWVKIGLLNILTQDSEEVGIRPKGFPTKYSPALANLGLKQLEKLDKYNSYRNTIANIYNEHLSNISDNDSNSKNRVYLRYPIKLKTQEEYNKVWELCRSQNIFLGNWFFNPLFSNHTSLKKYERLNYKREDYPRTEENCKFILNLPTNRLISKEHAMQLAIKIKEIINQS
jgi:dTDP-4-amino-4,6-dideoxygalactose transaminase